MAKLKNAPVALIIMDGVGYGNTADNNNAVQIAKTPVLDELKQKFPATHIFASGEYVGLPDGPMGTSEVGHTNICAGRVIYQALTRITKAIKDGDFFENKALLSVTDAVKADGGALHLMGLVSPGGVHSHSQHLYGLLELAKKQGIQKVYVRALMDGRSVDPSSAAEYVAELQAKIDEIGCGAIATLSGRYYAMDRDNRWERVQKAYDAVARGEGVKASDAVEAVNASYANDVTDEFVVPVVVGDYQGVNDGDGVIFFNFRPDRARELTHAFTDEEFSGFDRKEAKLAFATMTQYEEGLNVQVAYPPETIENTLGQVIAKNGMTQLRIAETEKYAHVTFFFNGGVEEPYEGEDRILVPSPKVATYDLQPEMSAIEVTDKVVEAIKSGKYDFIILNYANGDMVGHTGNLDATICSMEALDLALARLYKVCKEQGYIMLVTADHGNADEMLEKNKKGELQVRTAHSLNPVPFIIVDDDNTYEINEGEFGLANVAPTVAKLFGFEAPSSWEKSIIK